MGRELRRPTFNLDYTNKPIIDLFKKPCNFYLSTTSENSSSYLLSYNQASVDHYFISTEANHTIVCKINFFRNVYRHTPATHHILFTVTTKAAESEPGEKADTINTINAISLPTTPREGNYFVSQEGTI